MPSNESWRTVLHVQATVFTGPIPKATAKHELDPSFWVHARFSLGLCNYSLDWGKRKREESRASRAQRRSGVEWSNAWEPALSDLSGWVTEPGSTKVPRWGWHRASVGAPLSQVSSVGAPFSPGSVPCRPVPTPIKGAAVCSPSTSAWLSVQWGKTWPVASFPGLQVPELDQVREWTWNGASEDWPSFLFQPSPTVTKEWDDTQRWEVYWKLRGLWDIVKWIKNSCLDIPGSLCILCVF